MGKRPTIALYWCAGCGGCEESVIDLAEELPAVARRADIVFPDIRKRLEQGDKEIPARIDGYQVMTVLDVSDRQRKHLLAGGTLNYVKEELRGA